MIANQLVDGIVPENVVSPTTDREVSDVLHQQLADESWVLPVGGGTALTTGNTVEHVPIQMNLGEMRGILEYEPADLTVSVTAGTRWSELIATLAEHGQTVPVDVPFPASATVGGVVATGWAGPRRMRDGTIKDLLIGATFVRGDGLMAKAGGMVVKNVSGFEIPKLLHGSYGSLAVITSVNLKVVPAHESELTLWSDPVPFQDAVEDVMRLTRAEPTMAAAVVDGNGSDGEIAIRLSGRQKPIRELADRIRSTFNAPLKDASIDDGESADFWQRRSDALATTGDDRVMMEIGSTPAEIGGVVERLREELGDGGEVRYFVSPGVGSAAIESPAATISPASWQTVRERPGAVGAARYLVLHGPRQWRSENDVWSIPTDQRALMGALKHQFDPEHRLNRGRLWDHVPVYTRLAESALESMD